MTQPNRLEHGCLIVFAFAMLLIIGTCGAFNSRMKAKSLPAQLRWTSILENVDGYGLREGCVRRAYKLDQSTVEAIKRHGMRFFDEVERTGGDRPLDAWAQTPINRDERRGYTSASGRHIYAASAASCGTDHKYRTSFSRRGQYYAVFAGGEGLILVDPKAEIAWYLYFG